MFFQLSGLPMLKPFKHGDGYELAGHLVLRIDYELSYVAEMRRVDCSSAEFTHDQSPRFR